jgi:hypothetical protein
MRYIGSSLGFPWPEDYALILTHSPGEIGKGAEAYRIDIKWYSEGMILGFCKKIFLDSL